MKKWYFVLVLGMIALMITACGRNLGTVQDAGSNGLPKVTVSCDSRSTSMDLNTSKNLNLKMTGDGTFPGNCAHFCLAVPDGASDLEIGISNFASDLDLYVAASSLDKLMDSSTDASEFTSNETGLDPETVSVPDPASGAWYAQVCSYQSVDTDFTFTTSVK
jgi:hypothetical protein